MSIYKGNKLIAGGPNRPNWAKAVGFEIEGLYMEGYTVPSNGIVVGWFSFTGHIAVLDLKVNSITITRATFVSNTINSEGSVQCPVNKGDVIKFKTTQGSVPSYDIDGMLYFVPFIDSYTGN